LEQGLLSSSQDAFKAAQSFMIKAKAMKQ